MGGVFKSTNGGGGWVPVNTGLSNPVVVTLVIDPVTPTILYAAAKPPYPVSYSTVFKSMVGGARWKKLNTGLAGRFVQFLAIDPAMPTTVLAATADGGFVLDQSSTAPVAPGELTARLTGTRSRAAAQRP